MEKHVFAFYTYGLIFVGNRVKLSNFVTITNDEKFMPISNPLTSPRQRPITIACTQSPRTFHVYLCFLETSAVNAVSEVGEVWGGDEAVF